jgi:hypothetical protein
MKKFVVMYMAKPADFKKVVVGMKKMSKEQMAEFNKEWGDWTKKAGFVDDGAPLGKTMRVTSKGTKTAHNDIGGYSIVEAMSHSDAAKKMKNSPHFKMIKKGWIDVMEVLAM